MKKTVKIIEISVIILLLFLSCFLLFKFVNKIHHEKIDTTYMWNIKYNNIKVAEGSKEGQIEEKDNKVNLNVTLTKPEEFYEVTFDVVNSGTLTAYISKITKEITSTDDILKCRITYLDNSEIKKGDKLLSNNKETIKIRIEYPDTKAKIYKELKLNLQLRITYKAIY